MASADATPNAADTTGPNRIVVVGGGLAGAKAVEALRSAGYAGSLTLVAAEDELPYERPPLSKGYLMGQTSFDEAVVLSADWYTDNDVDLRLRTRAASVDAGARRVQLADGTDLPYDKLLLATGAVPRRLAVPGADAKGVHYLRTRADSDALRAVLGPDHRLMVIGAGWIGLETAAAARHAGAEVTVVETAEFPLLGVLGPQIGAMFADLHRAHGVDLLLGATINEIIVQAETVAGVRLGDGTVVSADAVLVGIGVSPDVALAESAGLALDNGVLVDASLRTSDPDILAVGDIANHNHPLLHTRVRVEHWATALNQPATAAAVMLGGEVTYSALPYFFSDQYDLGLEYLGHVPRDSDTSMVIRGDLSGREFVAFWIDRDSCIRAAMNVNVWDVVDTVRPLIADSVRVDPVALADPSIDYAACVR